ncbi:MAG: hypothetical protein EOO16_20410 [Chitinophagaceae bacterium]|nr:MAG: hypothetical protein EOO16_20410 [Chitinophagaceae bacterium]
MKKAFVILIGFMSILGSCGPNTGQEGTNQDGIKAVDENGAFPDTGRRGQGYLNENPATDSTRGENRTDIESRDSVNLGTKPR